MNNQEVLEAVSFPVMLRSVAQLGPQGWKIIDDRRAVVRTDTETVLSVVSDQYRLVPYSDVIEPILEAIDKNGGQLVERFNNSVRRSQPVRVEGEGKRIWIEAKFGGGIKIGNDEIVPRMVYGNSYDTTAAVRAIVGFYQVRCTNAGALMKPGRLKGFGGDEGFYRRHMGDDLEMNGIAGHIQNFLQGFGNRAGTLRSMAEMEVDHEDARKLLLEHVGERALAAKPFGEIQNTSAWALYSKITNHLTLDFKGGQQPMERRAYVALQEILRLMK